ncbi:putative quinol monooxygenase [Kozakia baliensis]|uniref:putative quinol monooxygenase n=1 Tax=Kozakia baliensis TaxID=153496 RepID=UPI0030846CF4
MVYRLTGDPAAFHVEETYRDEAAFEAHMGVAHGARFNKGIESLVEGGASQVVFLDTCLIDGSWSVIRFV